MLRTESARSPVTTCTSLAIFDIESSSCWTLVASRMQVISRWSSSSDRSTGEAAEPGETSSSASGSSAEGKVL